jgi:N-methylhydantoinase A/oxoprolinase/acetone carboxylase beta subunit
VALAGDAGEAQPVGERLCYFDGHGSLTTHLYADARLGPGVEIAGPAIIQRMGDSVTVPPGHRARIDHHNFVRLELP